MNILAHFAVSIAVVLGLLGLWLGVQALARRELPPSSGDRDVLACRGCGKDSCSACPVRRDS
ncbi:MAG: hypothetical protein OES78_05860 [Chromatiales bacterium]|nr:hypothetical protein [Chromatiales bacterium]MDH3894066.1 hypothetical protein [Chromatiales bacterium]MDH4013252.1 hypothetical protein [Chromatiales bacterium]